jgi:hypothetical protein
LNDKRDPITTIGGSVGDSELESKIESIVYKLQVTVPHCVRRLLSVSGQV